MEQHDQTTRGQIIIDIMGDEPEVISLSRVDYDGNIVELPKKEDYPKHLIPQPTLQIVPQTEIPKK